MKIKLLCICFLLLCFVVPSFAQYSIKGTVTDKKTGEGMPSSTVYLLSQRRGTLTDDNGNFEIDKLPKGKIKVQFSFIGYKTVIKTVFLNDKDVVLNVSMNPSIMQTEEVVISGGSYSTQHQNAIKIESIPLRNIIDQGTPSFTEALSYIPGVDMISKGTGVAKPVIRGLSMTNVLMLNNGVKLENFQFSENHPFIIDEFGVDRIEVIKGPASLLYGSDAVGGVIDVIKEKPAPEGKIVGDYNAQYHSNTNGVVTNLGIKGSSDHFFWGLRGGLKTHADYKDGNGDYVPNTRFNEYSFKANGGVSNSAGLFQLFYDFNRPKLGMCVGAAVPLVTAGERKNDVWYQDLTNHIISSRNTIFMGSYKLDVNASYQANNRKLQTDNFEMVDMDLNTLSYEVKAHLPSAENSEYIIGFQGNHKTNRNNEAPGHVLPDANVNDFSGFGLFQYTFFSKLRAQAGLRYDHRSISTVAETLREAVDNDFGDFSGSLGATYNISDAFLIRANFASSFRTPNIAELTENGVHGTRYEIGNADLVSQRNYESDISIHYHYKTVMIDVSPFYNRIDDYIFISPTGETSTGGYPVYMYSQKDAKIYGGEVSLNVLPYDWLDIHANYGYLIGKEDDGTYLPFIPQNKVRFNMKFKTSKIYIFEHPFFELGGTYAEDQSHPSLFETESKDYFVLNAGLGANVKFQGQLLSLSVKANNILNATYIDHLSTLKDIGYCNIGRNISVNLKVPF